MLVPVIVVIGIVKDWSRTRKKGLNCMNVVDAATIPPLTVPRQLDSGDGLMMEDM